MSGSLNNVHFMNFKLIEFLSIPILLYNNLHLCGVTFFPMSIFFFVTGIEKLKGLLKICVFVP